MHTAIAIKLLVVVMIDISMHEPILSLIRKLYFCVSNVLYIRYSYLYYIHLRFCN